MRTHLGRMEAFDALLESRWQPSGPEPERAAETPTARTDKPRRDRKRKSVVITPEGAGDENPGR